MELDEMKLAWQALDRRLEQQRMRQRRIERVVHLDKARRGLRPLAIGQVAQMLCGLIVAGVAAAFWIPRLHITHLLICGLLVHLFGLFLVVLSARALHLIHAIDYAAPVLTIQRRLAELRAWRVRVEVPANAVLGCFLWILALWMNLAWHGLDLWSAGFARWAVLSGATGLLIVALAVWWLRRAGLARQLEDHVAGASVRRVETMLAAIERFEQP